MDYSHHPTISQTQSHHRRERDNNDSHSGPPPVRNARFEKMAEEEREKNTARRDNSGPPPVVNSRFSAAAEADRSYNARPEDRGPPPVANSRFAAAAEADRSYNARPEDRGPPPVANSRFAAAADADRSYNARPEDRGPPPVANSRFAAAAEADRSYNARPDDRGPPPVANSRFAAAAAQAEEENKFERNNSNSRRDNRSDDRPPMPQNSRFAAAAAMDEDYVDREERERRFTDDRDRVDDPQQQRGGRYGRDGGNRDGDDYSNYRGGGPSRFGGPNQYDEPQPEKPSRVDELLKPKSAADENVLIPPSKEHEANMFKIPEKLLAKQEENFLSPSNKKKDVESKPEVVVTPEKQETAVPISAVSAEIAEELLHEFVSGKKQGDELKVWLEEKRPILPCVEKLIFHLLTEHEKMNPDPECGWADPSKYGAAIATLVEDDLFNQMQVLWGIQQYCDSIGFPKLNGESVVQSMFRAMYKYDLVLDDAFTEWKEDESDVHEKGKMNAIIQTVDWFNWLEEEEGGEEEEEEEEEA